MGTHESNALVDTGAFNSAMPLSDFTRLSQNNQHVILSKRKIPSEFVRVANGTTEKILSRVTIQMHILGRDIAEEFMIIDNIRNTILGFSFFKNNDVSIDCKTQRLHFPDITAQLNQVLQEDGKIKKIYKKNVYPVHTTKKVVIQPNEQTIIMCKVEGLETTNATCGIIEPLVSFEKRTDLCVTSSISKAEGDNLLPVGVINLAGNPVTINPKTSLGKFKVLSPQQIEFLTPIDPQVLAMVNEKSSTRDEADRILSAVYGMSHKIHKEDRQNVVGSINFIEQEPEGEREFWFATPETCDDPSRLSKIERKIYDKLAEFKKLEQRNPQASEEERKEFLSNFIWEESILSPECKARIEEKLVEYYKIFAVHRFDVGGNDEFKVKLTPEHDRPIYTQGNPVPVQLMEDMRCELAWMQFYGLIGTLNYSKYSSPIFAQRKSNGNLRLLIDLRRINHLLRHDYDNHNFPLSTLADAGNHLAGKKYLASLDASQAFHGISVDGLLSQQMLGFNFDGRAYGFKRLAQGLARSVSAFSSFMRKYLDKPIAANRCFQYVDDIGTAAHTEDELVENLEEIFKCIAKAGLRLSIKKCKFGLPKIKFLGNTITSQGISPNKEKVATFLETMKMPRNVRQVKRLIGFLQFFRNFLPSLSIKLIPFYKLLKNNTEFKIEEEHKKSFEILKRDLEKSTDTYLRFPKANLQYVIIADASFYGAGFVLMVEDYCNDAPKENKILAPVSFGSKVFNPAQLKFSIYAKEFLAVHYAFEKFAHILWGATSKNTLVLTDNKALARFFQAKTIPSTLWTFLDRVMSFPFEIGHIPGTANPAADYLSRLELEPGQKMELKMKDSIPMHRIELDIVAQTPPLINGLFACDDWNMTDRERVGDPPDAVLIGPEQQTIVGLAAIFTTMPVIEITAKFRLEKSGQMNSLQEINPLDHFDMSDRRRPIHWEREQYMDPTLRKVIEWVRLKKNPSNQYATFDENKYIKQLPRLTMRDRVLCRKFYDHTGKVQYYQTVIPIHLRKELLYRIHNTKFMGHKGMGKTITEFRKKFYFPGFTEYLVDYIKNCQSCTQIKPIKASLITPPMQQMMSKVAYPGNMMQIDIVGAMKESGGYTYILTAIDVFSRYLFAMPMRKQSAMAVAHALVGVFLKHAYIPDTIVTDCGTQFTSALITELAGLLEIEIKHASVKHSQTMGTIERSHASLKKVLKIYEGATGANWHLYLDYAAFCHNTSYHASTGCTPSLIFHGREPITPLDLRFGRTNTVNHKTHYEYTTDVKRNLVDLNFAVRENALISYHKYRTLYDSKANADPLKLHSYCYLLNPKLTTQNMTTGKHLTKWLPLYRVEKVLTNMNYIVRKTETHNTQCVHRIRLRPIVPQTTVRDVRHVNPQKFKPHKEILDQVREPESFDNVIPNIVMDESGKFPNTDVWYTPYLYKGIPVSNQTTPTARQDGNSARGAYAIHSWYPGAQPRTNECLQLSTRKTTPTYANVISKWLPKEKIQELPQRLKLRSHAKMIAEIKTTENNQAEIPDNAPTQWSLNENDQWTYNMLTPPINEKGSPHAQEWPNAIMPPMEPATITEILQDTLHKNHTSKPNDIQRNASDMTLQTHTSPGKKNAQMEKQDPIPRKPTHETRRIIKPIRRWSTIQDSMITINRMPIFKFPNENQGHPLLTKSLSVPQIVIPKESGIPRLTPEPHKKNMTQIHPAPITVPSRYEEGATKKEKKHNMLKMASLPEVYLEKFIREKPALNTEKKDYEERTIRRARRHRHLQLTPVQEVESELENYPAEDVVTRPQWIDNTNAEDIPELIPVITPTENTPEIPTTKKNTTASDTKIHKTSYREDRKKTTTDASGTHPRMYHPPKY